MISKARLPATISVDVDPLDLHLAGYGVKTAADETVYTVAIPRLLQLFAATGARATFFFVARDVRTGSAAARAIRAVEDAGHEAASHSLNHGIPFRKLPSGAFAEELRESRRRIEDASGRAVIGFRAPNWDLSERDFEALAIEGYKYDASAYPSFLLCAARMVVAVCGGGLSTFSKLKFLPFTLKQNPYIYNKIGGASAGFIEFPITTAGWTRFPVYHTVCQLYHRDLYQKKFGAIARTGRPFFYTLHAIDALSIDDGLDARLKRHPGVHRNLKFRLESLQNAFEVIGEYYQSVPYRELLHIAR